jgi:anti-sigma factor RsiW
LDERELLSAYIDNALGDNDRQSLEARLENDTALALQLETLQRTDAILLAAYDEPMTQAIPRRFFDLLGRPAPSGFVPSRGADTKPARAANDNALPWWCVSPKITRALQWVRGQNQ